jgi:alkylresorcinol/alkylpyrone synthase
VRFRAARSITAPEHRDALRFEQKNGMLRNILTLPVPKLAADHAGRVLDELLAEEGSPRGHRRVGAARRRPQGARGAALADRPRRGRDPTQRRGACASTAT